MTDHDRAQDAEEMSIVNKLDGAPAAVESEVLALLASEYDKAPPLPLSVCSPTELTQWTDFLITVGNNLGAAPAAAPDARYPIRPEERILTALIDAAPDAREPSAEQIEAALVRAYPERCAWDRQVAFEAGYRAGWKARP